MNPPSSLTCVLRFSAALAAIGTLLLAAGCGSNGVLIQGLGGNYSNASLKGQYVISQTGVGLNQQNPPACCFAFSEEIVFTADGNGNVQLLVDDFDQSGSLFEDINFAGTYAISKDGTGSLQFNFGSGNTTNYAITMIDDSHFYIIEQDTFATASGFGELQNTAAFSAIPSGTFVFKAHNLNTSSRVGAMTVAAGGAITGNEDLLNIGFSSTPKVISGSFSATLPDANGRGTFTLNDGTNFSFFYYVVSSGKIRILSGTGSLEIGQAETQTSTALPAGSYVFGSAGDTSVSGAAGIHSAGVFSTDGSGNITAGGAVDFVQDTTVNSNLAVTGGGYTLTGNGRGTINLTLTGGVIPQQIFWIVDSTHAYFLVNSNAAVEDGTFTVQNGSPFSAVGGQAAFVMDGFDTAFKDRVGAFEPTTGGNFKWNQAANSFGSVTGGVPSTLATNGTFQVSSNGRVAVTVNNVTPSVVFYLSSASSGVMVQEDANIGGAFTVQAGQ